jgi:phosphoglucomutase
MAAIIAGFRDNQPAEIGGVKVARVQDFSTSVETNKDGSTAKLSQPKANVLKYWLDDGSWVALRPSGTEPKLKFYIGVESDSQQESQAKIDIISADLMKRAK